MRWSLCKGSLLLDFRGHSIRLERQKVRRGIEMVDSTVRVEMSKSTHSHGPGSTQVKPLDLQGRGFAIQRVIVGNQDAHAPLQTTSSQYLIKTAK